MSLTRTTQLLKLADREFRQLAGEPRACVPAGKFKAIKLNAARFDPSADRRRGAALRLTAVLLSDDHVALEQRIHASDRSADMYAGAVGWLGREAESLRKLARLLDTAAARVGTVLSRESGAQPGDGS